MKSKMNPGKLLSIWESYWGELSSNWAESFLADVRIGSILEFDDLMILQAVQENKKLDLILNALERKSSQQKIHEQSTGKSFSKTNLDNRIGLGTESEISEIKQWLMEFSRGKLNPDEVVTWLNVKTDIETCKAKKRYGSEKDAILALIRLGKQNGEVIKQLPYKCNVCRQFHNSHLLSRETINDLQRKYS
jgi:hypothetical protein